MNELEESVKESPSKDHEACLQACVRLAVKDIRLVLNSVDPRIGQTSPGVDRDIRNKTRIRKSGLLPISPPRVYRFFNFP